MQSSFVAPLFLGVALRGSWFRVVQATHGSTRASFRRAIDVAGWRDRFRSTRRKPVRDAVPDPVALTVLAIDRLAPASIRAAWVGMPVTVTVPDAMTLEIFRAALCETQKHRSTDRLIGLVLEPAA